MAIGMITVGFILFVVVSVGNIIVRITNTIKLPEPKPVVSRVAQTISSSKMAAIVTAVSQVTQGRGKVTSVEKMD